MARLELLKIRAVHNQTRLKQLEELQKIGTGIECDIINLVRRIVIFGGRRQDILLNHILHITEITTGLAGAIDIDRLTTQKRRG